MELRQDITMVQALFDFRRFERRFLLVTNVPCHQDETGRLYVDRAWRHDLLQHLSYLKRFTLAAPRIPRAPEVPDLVEIHPSSSGMGYFPLPPQRSTLEAVRNLPDTVRALTQALREVDVVQANVAGWPYPLGWVAMPIARALGKKCFVVVESAPWRPSGATTDLRWQQRVRASVYEVLARHFCRSADLSAYTQPSYRDTLHNGDGRGPAYITPATWINDEQILEDEQAEALWRTKRSEPVRFLFAARLTETKGVLVLLEALDKLDKQGVRARVDVIGSGELAERVQEASQAFEHVELRLLDPVPYGPQFFALVDRYHGMLAPILSDEQPRIVFDAAARALPVIASDADGLRPYVHDGESGMLLARGNVEMLALTLERLSSDVKQLEQMGMKALEDARPHTHRAMHARRSHLLASLDAL